MLVLRDVSRPLGRDLLLNRVSLDFPSGAPTAVLGLSPPARDAFLRLLEGADKPKTGSLRLNGKEIAHVRRERGRIVRVGPNGIRASGQRVNRVVSAAAAERVGLAGRMGVAVAELAPEERVRLAIGAALERQPDVILLDSPSSEMPAAARDRFAAELGRMVTGAGSVVVLAGAPDEARGLAGRIVVLSAGRVAQAGTAEEVFAAPANLAAAAATAAPGLNVVGMVARNGAGVLADGSVFQPPEGFVLPAAGTCTLAFRPDDATLERKDGACVRFVVRTTGGAAEAIAGRRYARVTFANATWLTPEPAVAPAPGMTLNAFVDRAKLMMFDSEGTAIR